MDNKNKWLKKDLDLIFVYLFIFLVGVAIVLGMVRYLGTKVTEFSDSSISSVANY